MLYTGDFRLSKHELEQIGEEGEVPVGAIVVYEGRVIGRGRNACERLQDPTAHAEMEAIRDAARSLGTRDLSECILYSTSRPCRMCQTAAYWANIKGIYFGENPIQAVRPEYGC